MQYPVFGCIVIGLQALQFSNFVRSPNSSTPSLEGFVEIQGVDNSHKECVIFVASKQIRNDEVATFFWCGSTDTLIAKFASHDMSQKIDISGFTKNFERPTPVRISIQITSAKATTAPIPTTIQPIPTPKRKEPDANPPVPSDPPKLRKEDQVRRKFGFNASTSWPLLLKYQPEE